MKRKYPWSILKWKTTFNNNLITEQIIPLHVLHPLFRIKLTKKVITAIWLMLGTKAQLDNYNKQIQDSNQDKGADSQCLTISEAQKRTSR